MARSSKRSTKETEKRSGSGRRNAQKRTSEKRGSDSTASAHKSARISAMTTDHNEIRRWAEERGGVPACVRGTGTPDDIGMVRIEFPGKPNTREDSLQEITWDEFFDKFDENNLALVYEETTARGQKSNFNKIVKREQRPKARSAAAGR